MDAPDASDPQEPPPPKEKGVFKGKRKRNLAYRPKKGTKNQKDARPRRADIDEPATSATNEVASSATNQPTTTATARAESTVRAPVSLKKTPKTELLAMLKKAEQELAAARAEVLKKEKTIHTLQTKNNKLVEGTLSARSAVREAKQYAKSVEDAAAQTVRKSRDELAAVEERERGTETLIHEKEVEWVHRVQKVREEEQVSQF